MSSSLSAIPGLVPLPVFIEEAQPHPSDATWAEISPSVVLCTEEEFEAAVAPCELPAGWQRSEAYLLDLSNGAAQVSAISELGLSRGLRRLNTLAIANHHREPVAVKIFDYPAYKHRGLHIDVSRHFFGVPTIVRVMDAMSELALNILHLHLSDDQGWRIEIPQFPELIERSSDCAVGGEEGGYYSLEDYQTLVEEARSRMIAIIPEIDIPGHVNAALHAIEGLNPDGVCPPLYEGTEVGFSTLSTKAPATQAFLEAVVQTLAPFSPAGIHIGGDESFSTAEGDYPIIVGSQIERIHALGKRALAWEEAADLLGEGDLVQVWHDDLEGDSIARAVARGVRAIMSPGPKAYFDMKEYPEQKLGITWAGILPLKNAWDWDPEKICEGVDREGIEGVEACLWSETIRREKDVWEMLLPRLAGLAEVAWAGGPRGSWEDFLERLAGLEGLWRGRGWYIK